MRIIYLMQDDSGPWGIIVILIIVGISFLANIIKKVMQNTQNYQDGQGQPPKPRSRFLDLIEEVRKMAEQGGEPKPGAPGQQPPFVKIERTIQKKSIISPVVPKLKPVGDVKISSPAPQSPTFEIIKPYSPQKPAIASIWADENEMFDDEEMISADEARRYIAEKERALKRREDKLRKAEEKLSQIESSVEKRQVSHETGGKGSAKEYAIFEERRDYSSVFRSLESLKDAIVLREILGPPKALRRRGRYARTD